MNLYIPRIAEERAAVGSAPSITGVRLCDRRFMVGVGEEGPSWTF